MFWFDWRMGVLAILPLLASIYVIYRTMGGERAARQDLRSFISTLLLPMLLHREASLLISIVRLIIPWVTVNLGMSFVLMFSVVPDVI